MEIIYEENGITKSHSFDLTDIYFVLMEGKVLKLDTQEIMDAHYNTVTLIEDYNGETITEIHNIYSSRGQYVKKLDDKYLYLEEVRDICNGNFKLLFALKDQFTNDTIWNLYLYYYKKYVAERPIIGSLNARNDINVTIEHISNYDIGL